MEGRHGAGPLANELPHKPHAGIEDRTNEPNEFQGTLRFAHLDLDLLARTIRTDFADALACPGIATRLELAVSCLDQVGDAVSYIENGTLQTASPGALVDRLAGRIRAGVVYTAWGPTRNMVRIRGQDPVALTWPWRAARSCSSFASQP